MRRIALCFFLVTGCVSRDQTMHTAQLTEGCLLNSDCVNPLVCVFNRCHQPCNEPRDCPANSDCQLAGDPPTLVCMQVDCATTNNCPAGTVCNQDDHKCRAQCPLITCDDRQSCVKQQCVWPKDLQADGGFSPIAKVPGACTYNSECDLKKGQRCSFLGQCVAECLESVDCATRGDLCENGRCVAADAGTVTDAGTVNDAGSVMTDAGASAGCTYNSECDGGVCSARGLCIAQCLTTVDCAVGFRCEANLCVFRGSTSDGGTTVAGCSYNSDCDAGLRCGRTGNCEAECLTSRDCARTEECRSGRCIPFIGDAGLPDGGLPLGWGDRCFVNSNCLAGLTCGPGGQCVYECAVSADCAASTAGQCCSNHRCAPGALCSVPGGDAGVRDAGLSLDGGACLVDNDCVDADYCNGLETCRAGRCVGGTNPCNDNNPCTNDVCNGVSRQCSYQSVATDVDQDGHFPLACGQPDAGADDCDDNDNTVFPGAPELCDWKDNNCNGAMDEGRWRERAGARGLVSSIAAYPANAGAPAAVRNGNEVALFAASHNARGSLDGFRLDLNSLSVMSGPLTLASVPTSWQTCFSGVTRYGTQVVLPFAVSTDAGVVVTSLHAGFSAPQAQCVTGPDSRRTSLLLTTLGSDLSVTASSTVHSVTTPTNGTFPNFTGTVLGVGVGTGGSSPFTKASAAWHGARSQFIVTWFDNLSVGNVVGLRFNTVSPSGVVGLRRDVYAGVSATADAAPPLVNLVDPSDGPPMVAVGSRGVLFAWVNVPVLPSNLRAIRWVIYDTNLSTVRAGPFSTTLSGQTGSTEPALDSAHFDGTQYVLHVSTPSSVNGALNSRFLAINEDGVLLPTLRTLATSSGPGSGTEYGWAAGSSTGNAIMGTQGFAAAYNQGNFLRVVVGGYVAGVSNTTVDVDLAQAHTSRTDFSLVALSPTSLGVFWADGQLRKTVVECQ